MSTYALFYTEKNVFAIDTFYELNVVNPSPEILNGQVLDKETDTLIPVISLSKTLNEQVTGDVENVLVICSNSLKNSNKKVAFTLKGMINSVLPSVNEEDISLADDELIYGVISSGDFGKVLVLDIDKVLSHIN